MSMYPIVVPDLGVDGAVDVIEINVAIGDQIKVDDIVAVLESDKATLEVPATQSGTVSEIHIKPGVKVKQGDPLITVTLSSSTDSTQANVKTASAPISVSATVPTATVVAISPATPAVETPQVISAPVTSTDTLVSETVVVPDIGADSATVIELVSQGAALAAEAIVTVLESDKATMEVPAPHAGKVQTLYLKVGDKVKSGDKIAELEIKQSEPPPVNKDSVVPAPKVAEPSEQRAAVLEPVTTARVLDVPVSASNVHAGPAVRRMAREFGIDLNQVMGTGPKSRVLKQDLMRFTKERLARPVAASSTASLTESLPEIDFSRFGAIELLPRSRIQKVSAKNLSRSSLTIPQVTQFDEADITDLEAFRRAQTERTAKEGYKLTLLAFMVKAVVAVLKKHPDFNSSLDNQGENLIRKQYYHIGIAVETQDGLMVPVLKNAEQKGVKDIAIELQALASLARDKKLKPADMQGASFTISSLGGIGGTAFTPLVNWPEVAILGVSKSQLKPVYVGEELQARLCLPLSLSYDHRVIDGAAGARFTRALVEVLGDIRYLVL